MSSRILLVEDDSNLGYVIQDNLNLAGYQVTICQDGEAAYQTFTRHKFDLCIFDVMLPRLDGFSLASRIRKRDTHTPILFLTAKSLVEDKLEGFKSGADDYIVKPFDMQELLLRMQVFLRRTNGLSTAQQYHIGKYDFNHGNLTLACEGFLKKLTQKEADILKMLCEHQGRLLKREMILNQVWGDDDYFLGRSMDVFISKLRKYLKRDENIAITNHHGVGFQLTLVDKPQ